MLWVRRSDGQCADGGHGLTVEDWEPGVAAIDGFENTAGGRARVIGGRVAGNACYGCDAVADGGAEEAESECVGDVGLVAALRKTLGGPDRGAE